MDLFDRRKNSRRREDTERDRLFDLTQDLLAVAGADGQLRQVNPSWERLTGWAPADLVGKILFAFVHEDDHNRVQAAFSRLAIGTQSLECRVTGKDRRSRWLEMDLARDPDPEHDAVYVVARDIARRKLAEAESSRLAAIVASSNDAIVSASLQGQIESWNPAAERIFGYKSSEVLGKPLTLLVPRLSTDQTPAHLGQVGAGEQLTGLLVERKRKDGSLVTVSLTLSPVRDAAGAVVATSVIAREIAEGPAGNA